MRWCAVLLLFAGLYANAECGEWLSAPAGVDSSHITEIFISYLTSLEEQRILSVQELENLARELSSSVELSNPLRANGSTARRIHAIALDSYLHSGEMDRARLAQWLGDHLRRGEVTREERREKAAETHLEFSLAKFERIHITGEQEYDLEIMTTPVTQFMWFKRMGDNPSGFWDGPDSYVLEHEGKKLSLCAENPVERISWWSAVTFANKLSEDAGLPTAYDLSAITNWYGSAAGGDLMCPSENKIEPTVNAPGGSINRAEGYRLPTMAESDFLQRNTDAHVMTHTTEYAWTSENSDYSTHPVAHLKPIQIGDAKFYDVYGNVAEWLHDWHPDTKIVATGPYATRGSYQIISPFGHDNYGPGLVAVAIGFRLVRTIPK